MRTLITLAFLLIASFCSAQINPFGIVPEGFPGAGQSRIDTTVVIDGGTSSSFVAKTGPQTMQGPLTSNNGYTSGTSYQFANGIKMVPAFGPFPLLTVQSDGAAAVPGICLFNTSTSASGDETFIKFTVFDDAGTTRDSVVIRTSLADDGALSLTQDFSIRVVRDNFFYDMMVVEDPTLAAANYGVNQMANAYVGAVSAPSGWSSPSGTDTFEWSLPAAETASTLIVPFNVTSAEYITGFQIGGMISSAGNTVTLDAELFKRTTGGGTISDVSQGSITQINVTANTEVLSRFDLIPGQQASTTIGATSAWYVKLTGTTGAATEIKLIGCYALVSPVPE